MLKSILQLILDFALEPALIDAIGAIFLFFLHFLIAAKYSVIRSLALSVLGYGLCFIALATGFSVTAATGNHWMIYLGFAGVFFAGIIMTVRNKKGLARGMAWSAGLMAIIWLTDVLITSNILFE